MNHLDNESLEVGIAKLVHSGDYILESLVNGPEVIENGGLLELLEKNHCTVVESKTATLTQEESKQYGAWNLLGLASYHLADIITNQLRRKLFPIGLLPTCSGMMGILAGFQKFGLSQKLPRIGLIWMDAHGDINTPDTSPSGLLAGMPVAIATGLCLERLRLKCGLEIALPTEHVTMVGVRDTDPLEQEIINQNRINHITVEEIQTLSPIINKEMERLTKITDFIYVHLDIDVLDATEVPGHGLAVKGGPTSEQLGAALESIFEYPKVAGLGIAGYPYGNDSEGITLRAILSLIESAIIGVQRRIKK